eukprot:3311239-Alexandrium_andersonii.AAC.1
MEHQRQPRAVPRTPPLADLLPTTTTRGAPSQHQLRCARATPRSHEPKRQNTRHSKTRSNLTSPKA